MSARITVAEIARDMKVGRESVYSLLRNGTIPSIPHGRGWIITRDQYEAWKRGEFPSKKPQHRLALVS